MRVLHVTEASLGGVRRYIEGIGRVSSGWESGLAYSLRRADVQFPSLLSELRDRGWALFEVGMNRAITPASDVKAVASMRKVISDYGPTIVHAHSSKGGAIARLAVRTTRAPRPKTAYTPNAIAREQVALTHRVERWLGRFATDVVVAVTPSERDEIVAAGIVPRTRCDVVWSVIDTDLYRPTDKTEARRRAGLDPIRPIVVGVGRLTEQKDPLLFVEVLDRLRSRMPDVLGVWVGDGELRGAVDSSVAAKQLEDGLVITGWVDDVRTFVASADVVLSTARFESFGYSNAEALAMGIPVVGTQVTGTVDLVVPRETGWLFAPGDPDGAVEGLALLFEDDSLRTACAEEGRRRVQRLCDAGTIGESLRRCYEALANGSR